ncbi:MAG: TolC family protein [Chthoniobacter sp.]|uniref:TolC family protein n=1 Tax=Chthoniobacter sp. TaxID=2510640 RepID=UPI0032A8E748
MSSHAGSDIFRGILFGLLGVSVAAYGADPGAAKSKTAQKSKGNPSVLVAAATDASAAAPDQKPATPVPTIPTATPATDPLSPPLITPADPANPTLPDGTTVPPSTTTPLIPPINGNARTAPPKFKDKTLPPVPSKADASEKASEVEGTISTHRIGLLDAVRITLLKNPAIKLTAEDVAQARASLRSATGQFDTTLTGNVRWAYQQNELPPDQAKAQQDAFHQNQVKRGVLEKGIVQSEAEIASLKAGIKPLPDTSSITDPKAKATADLQNQIDQQIQDLADQILDAVATPEQLAQIQKIRKQSTDLGAQVQSQILTGLKSQLKQLNKQIEQFPPITVRKTETTSYELDLVKEFRNGISFGPFVQYARSNDNFTRRTGIGDLSTSEVGLQVIVPLGKGSGAAASAQERSAAVNLEASRLNLHHTMSQAVLQTIQAYWGVVAAQERLRLLFRSELIAGALVDLSRELIKADELAPSELSQIQAQYAIRTSQRVSAEQDLVSATQNLAVFMGLDLREMLTAPLAAESFPESLPASMLRNAPRQALASVAMENRADRLAAMKMQLSGKILVDAARINLRPQMGLQVRTSYAGVGQDSQYEQYWRAFDREVGPSVSAALSFAWPLENNFARGQYEQSTSFYNTSLIQTDQLSRSIIASVVVDLSAVQLGRDQIDKALESSNDFEKALETEREKLKLGNSTLINTIETEQNLTNALLQVISARQQYATAIAQLRFDTGTLVPHTVQSVFSREDFVTLPPVRAYAVSSAQSAPTLAPVTKPVGKPAKKK